jgi:hypothetical protein
VSHRTTESPCGRKTNEYTCNYKFESALKDESKYIVPIRAKRNADSDFMGALADSERNDTVHPYYR